MPKYDFGFVRFERSLYLEMCRLIRCQRNAFYYFSEQVNDNRFHSSEIYPPMCHVHDHLPLTCVTLRKYYWEREIDSQNVSHHFSSAHTDWRGDDSTVTFPIYVTAQREQHIHAQHPNPIVYVYVGYTASQIRSSVHMFCLSHLSTSNASMMFEKAHKVHQFKPFRKWQLRKKRPKNENNRKETTKRNRFISFIRTIDFHSVFLCLYWFLKPNF